MKVSANSIRSAANRIAKIVDEMAAAIRCAVRLYCMMRTHSAYTEIFIIENNPTINLIIKLKN